MPTAYKCAACGEEASKICQGCKLVGYCGRDCQQQHWREGHKVICSKVPKAVQKAEVKIDNFSLGQYDVRPTAPFMVTEAVAQRGEIQEESHAQDLCYDAMEMEKGSTDKLLRSLEALRVFALSTEAWGMLGHYFEFELNIDDDLQVHMYSKALKMYDNGIRCARMLNPSWTADRDAELSYGVIEHRPYYRNLAGRARVLHHLGRTQEAIAQAKKIMKWNPSDNQGLRLSMINWFLEVGDTESCTNLLRKYGASDGAHLAYADLVLQFLRWKKDDASEKDVKRALYIAIKANPHVPELIFSLDDRPSDDDSVVSGYSPGEESEAEYYIKDSRSLWENNQDLVEWIKSKKTLGGQQVPSHESDVIELLKSGHNFQMTCAHTNLDGDSIETSDVIGTQRRDKCRGYALMSFKYPRQLSRTHVDGGDIIFFNNDHDVCDWRKTKFSDIHRIPFWPILLQFYDEDIDPVREIDQERPRTARTRTQGSQRPFNLDCKECGKPGRFCALDRDGTAFYCSEECMSDFLEEVEPHYIDMKSEVLKVQAWGESSIKTLNLDDAFRVATEHMPNLKGVDIYINQQYFLSDSMYCDEGERKIILSAPILKNFLERKKHELVGISFCLDQCCEEQFKKRTDGARALVAIGSMPNLKKLELSNIGFDDVDTITRCIGTDLESLRLAHISVGSDRYCHGCQPPDVDELVRKLSQIRNLRTLALEDIALSPLNLRTLAPRLARVRDLSLEGAFGGQGGSINDASLTLIADSCPNLLSLNVSYQREITYAGLKRTLRNLNLIDLEASDISLSTHQVADIVGNSSLKFLRYSNAGNRWESPGEQELRIIREAVVRRNGEVILCTDHGGMVKLTLPSTLRANQEAAKNFVNEACKAGHDVFVTCKWDKAST